MPGSLRRFTACALAALMAGGLASCGGGGSGGEPPEVVRDVSGLSGARRERALEEKAHTESGSLRFYTSLEEGFAKAVAEAFEKRYSLPVKVVQSKGEELQQRVSQEVRAGAKGADVLETDGPGMVQLEQQKAFLDLRPPARSGLVPSAAHEGWTATRFNIFTVSRNTDHVPEAQRPRSYAELGERRWHGRILMEAGDVDWYVGLRDYWTSKEGLTLDQADARFKSMARNASAVDGHSLMDALVGSGEFDVAVSAYNHTVNGARKRGEPIDWRPPVSPVVRRPNGVGVLRGAQHPAKALLFVDWLLTDGQEVLAREGLNPTRRDLVRSPGARIADLSPEQFVKEAPAAARNYQAIIRLAGKGPEK